MIFYGIEATKDMICNSMLDWNEDNNFDPQKDYVFGKTIYDLAEISLFKLDIIIDWNNDIQYIGKCGDCNKEKVRFELQDLFKCKKLEDSNFIERDYKS